ncbi:hypothetical protein D3C76_1768060 [compost metagenome]
MHPQRQPVAGTIDMLDQSVKILEAVTNDVKNRPKDLPFQFVNAFELNQRRLYECTSAVILT